MNGISIVVCTFNGESRLKETLESIIKLKAEFPWEVLVIDNNSRDKSSEISNLILSSYSVDFRIISEPKPGLTFARWRGVAESKYDIILFCDDDNHLQEDFLIVGYEIFSKNPNCGILGSKGKKNILVKDPDWFERFSHSYAVGSLGKEDGAQPKGSYHYGASCFFKKVALEKLYELGFRSVLSDRTGSVLSSGGDVELCLAVQLLGFELWFDSRLVFDHFIEPHRLKWSYYLKLKEGIASSFPLLESYRIDEFSRIKAFKFHIKREFWLACKGIVKSGLLYFYSKDKIHQVNFLTSKTKIISYFKNKKKTIEAFERNRRIFSA